MVLETHQSVFIEENSPRDGIQNESAWFSLDERISLIETLAECGFQRIQIGAFVDSRKVPQMVDTEKILDQLPHNGKTVYSALVLNECGMGRALASGIKHVSYFVSASDTHSRKNTNRSVEEGIRGAFRAIPMAKSHGMAVQGGIMNAFRCQFDGMVPPERVLRLVQAFTEMEVDEINLADTAGLAHPPQVIELIGRVRDICDTPITLHLHDTLGFGLVNAYAAWNVGVRRFDASCGGLGGCPFIPGVAGNIASEDMVNLFESMGVRTGVHLPGLAVVIGMLRDKLKHPLWSRYGSLSSETAVNKGFM